MDRFIKPEMEVIEFCTEDVITASAGAIVGDMDCGDCENSPTGVCEWHACVGMYDPFESFSVD